ncbi:hypothetical protein COV53_03840 [Candidatus Gottesmanbacteria bacterium CG11_big_fil_rev_8_21_14_0_20_37_11]|uniref:Uncharacterized protein n=3 Tax=Candidatus Gottesmaniibacteriota TaxID=1752720 RepID=A0A2M7RTK4_9BACT|nr:MAG: hypothetical protein AUJ73_00350 [Candidatus Gottesmanbacteria bacterium CG1_02_37_22]PIP33161.1 MAG: hypothetical protein COX23_00855 [Candidatus Gottesmanbacteria bacterium CG23_combo_of_CG06-09_8_20_14_all_37_19]PIR08277.1 MAG: hypothetical protein COV53_03840 [Candidatus Gottesmanbacteria bacterium CG11_big_fil_rev_8_21_14_0_20_37_11]PIZ03304.1 MAG: hypothetical protein COY59_00235 [Candidatus Gottesmanbacteria bacterium CG_4_10_14_0_8_um_filter_37_24]
MVLNTISQSIPLKLRLPLLILLGILILYILVFHLFQTCNIYSEIMPIREQRCNCIGLLFNENRNSMSDSTKKDICIGFAINKVQIIPNLGD